MRAAFGAAMALALLAGSPARALDLDPARSAIADVAAACAADAGKLWGVSLCGPLLLVDPETHEIVASQNTASGLLTRSGDVFTGKLPTEMNVANTAIAWDGVQWIMVALPLPTDPIERRRLLMHEAFHRVQTQFGLPMASTAPAHLATRDGRVLMRLEWRALAAALTATSPQARRQANADALAFRAARRRLAPEAAEQEIQLELNEGMAEYTGQRLSGRNGLPAYAAGVLGRAETRPSFVRNFAYPSGPAYGLLLDDADPAWRTKIAKARDLGGLLATAYGVTATGDIAAAGAPHGRDAVLAEETKRAEAAAIVERALRGKLVDGPTLTLPLKDMSVSFDPNTLVPLPPQGVAYPAIRVSDRWGILTVTDGALIDSGFTSVTVAAPVEGAGPNLTGPGWTLTLAPGWTLGGTREKPELKAPAP